MRDSFFEEENEEGMECEVCHKKKLSVLYRPNEYAQDVENDTTAYHTVCEECAYQNRMDI